MYPQMLAGFFKDNFNTRRFLATVVYGRLKDGVSITNAEASLKTIAAGLESAYPRDNGGRTIALTPLAEPAVRGNQHGQITLAGGLLLGHVALLLCILRDNLANLPLQPRS